MSKTDRDSGDSTGRSQSVQHDFGFATAKSRRGLYSDYVQEIIPPSQRSLIDIALGNLSSALEQLGVVEVSERFGYLDKVRFMPQVRNLNPYILGVALIILDSGERITPDMLTRENPIVDIMNNLLIEKKDKSSMRLHTSRANDLSRDEIEGILSLELISYILAVNKHIQEYGDKSKDTSVEEKLDDFVV